MIRSVSDTPSQDDPWSEVLLAWALALGLVYGSARLLPEQAVPFGTALSWVAVAVGFLVARRRSLTAHGIAWRSVRATFKKVALYSAVFLPLYAAGFFLAFGVKGWGVPNPQIFVFSFVGNLAFAALPEEIFFRGYVQSRLTGAATTVRRIGFLPITRPIVETAAIFAVTHAVFLANPFSLQGLERLTTFFPGLLFGALRHDADDVMTPAIFHALCNAWLYSLQNGYLA